MWKTSRVDGCPGGGGVADQFLHIGGLVFRDTDAQYYMR
jgi:hypothetical protein